jgi:hypothetical protein
MLPVIELLTLLGLGEQWEQQIRQEFGRGAETCQIPSADEQSKLCQLVQQLNGWSRLAELPSEQSSVLAASELGLEIKLLKTPKQRYLWLCEKPPRRGWGQILWRCRPEQPIPVRVIEAPHPAFDAHTPELALQIFEECQADVLLVAGSHRLNRAQVSADQKDRGVADPAHSRQTAFHSMHHGLVDQEHRALQIFQIHGFKSRTPQDPEAVISDGLDDGYWGPTLCQLELRLKQQGIKAQRADFASNWLTARSNVQLQDLDGQSRCQPKGSVEFIHIEFSETVRSQPTRFGQAVKAFQPRLPGLSPGPQIPEVARPFAQICSAPTCSSHKRMTKPVGAEQSQPKVQTASGTYPAVSGRRR